MPIRDILVTLMVFGSLPYILSRPWVGILVWSWLSYMNPHRLGWGFAYNMPFAQIVALTLFAAMLFSRDYKKPPITTSIILWWIFLGWMGLTTLNALNPDGAIDSFITVMKIQLIVFLTLIIMYTKERIIYMVWVIYLSIGFFGIKGGLFALQTGGGARIYGPANSFISDNNHLAVALLMVLPLGYYLYQYTNKKWVRRGLVASMGLIAISIIASYSRGAFLSIMAVALMLWWKSSNKGVIALLVLPLLPIGFLAMPQSWHDRMSTIENYEQDASARARINSWTYSINVANSRITGGGLNSYNKQNFAIWAPDPTSVFVAHSIYFSALGDHGWPGLLLFISIFFFSWRLLAQTIKKTAEHPEHKWASDLCKMIQVGYVGYLSGGAFLSLTYFDLPWHMIVIVALLNAWVNRNLDQNSENPTHYATQRPSNV